MLMKTLSLALASAAIAVSPASAKPGGGAGGGHGNAGASINSGGPAGAALESRINSMGPANAGPMGIERSNPNSVLKTNPVSTEVVTTTNPSAGVSQGPNHASTTGIAHANERSVLANGAVSADALPGLTTGLTVQNSSGTNIGTVSKVVADSSGNIRLVVVTSSTGEVFRLLPNILTIDGGVVVATGTGG